MEKEIPIIRSYCVNRATYKISNIAVQQNLFQPKCFYFNAVENYYSLIQLMLSTSDEPGTFTVHRGYQFDGRYAYSV